MPSILELARIAAAVNLLRPDWPTKSVQTLLERDHATWPYHDLAVAAVWVATDPTSKTPARLSEAGPWWQALGVTSTPRLERFDHDQWTAQLADKVPPPADFAEKVTAARAAVAVRGGERQTDGTGPVGRRVDAAGLARARAELEELRRRVDVHDGKTPVDPVGVVGGRQEGDEG